jgi:hypothetical protein
MTAGLSPRQRALLDALRERRAPTGRGHRIPRRADGARPAPLSFAQQRLWYLEALAPGTPLYLLPTAHRLGGPLDVGALAWALGALAARHESLRTTFATRDGQTVQVVADAAGVPLPIVDRTHLYAGQIEADLRQRLAAEADRPMDLAAGPPLRATLLRYAADDHILLLTLHHAVADGVSLDILNTELAELYAARRAGRAPALAELPIQYPDFAEWERDWLAGPGAERQLAYCSRPWPGRQPWSCRPTGRAWRCSQRPARRSRFVSRCRPRSSAGCAGASAPRRTWCCWPLSRSCWRATPGSPTWSPARRSPTGTAPSSKA